MPTTLNTQVLYNWAGQPVPVPVMVGEKEQSALRATDYIEGMGRAETAFGQFVISQNQDALRVSKLINAQGLAVLDPTTATAAEAATELNKYLQILTSLVKTSS